MLLILTVTLPLFCVILAGWLAARGGLLGPPGIRGLTGFVFYFALPLMLFRTMASAPLGQTFDGPTLLGYLAAGSAVYLLAALVARFGFGGGLGEQAVQGVAATFGNTVFIGIPVAVGAFGAGAAVPMALFMAVENAILMPFALLLLEIARAGAGDRRRAPAAALMAVLRNPVVMSVVIGVGAGLLAVPLPAFVEGLARLSAGAAVPCALFALGATLARLPIAERLLETSWMVALKLAIYPLVVGALLMLVPGADPSWRAVALLAAAMPMGANVYLVAERYQTCVARASTAVLLSTVVSVVTVSALAVALVGIVPPPLP